MKFLAKATEVTKVEADILAVFAGSDEAKKIDRGLGGMLTEVAIAEDFEAKQGNTLQINSSGKIAAKRVLLVGLGKPAELAMSDLQTIAATIGRAAKKVAAKRVAVAISDELVSQFIASECAQGLVEGITLGTYIFNKHKSAEEQKKEKIIDEVNFLVAPSRLDATQTGISRGEVASQAVVFARDLVNEPPSQTTPTYLGNIAKQLAKGQKGVSVDVLDKKDMEALSMNALLGVARGSDEDPKFIKLSYKGTGRKTIALIGKGITFDTGGLSLKDPNNMETMKLDMAGAATILGIFKVLPSLKPKVNVVGLISATENMPGSKAVKPGDVVRAMNGKTIEILNTDAEGRVVLSDALSYAAAKVKPDVMIDLATLTGACMVALGEEITGLFSNDKKLADSLKNAAEKTGEKVWELPLAKEYKEKLKSAVADIKNISGSKYGGAINGALFLQEFVPKTTPWAHLDIAGPAFAEKDAPLTPRGGTGFGVRMVIRYLSDLSNL